MKTFILFLFLAFSIFHLKAEVISSNGNGEWLDPNSWDLGRIPQDNDTILIYDDITIFGDNIVLDDALIKVFNGGVLAFDNDGLRHSDLFLMGDSELRIYTGGKVDSRATPATFSSIWQEGSIVPVWNGTTHGDVNGPANGYYAVRTATVLPVTFVSFNALKTQNTVSLFWSTASEKNNAYFEVQRSNGVNEFETIATINGSGTTKDLTEYSLEDFTPLNGENYYRLKQVDYDGKFSYSSIVYVAIQLNESITTFFPNPFHSELLLNAYDTENNTELTIFDGRGMVLVRETLTLDTDGVTSLTELVQNLNAGKYFVHLDINGSTERHQIIKAD